MLFGKKMQFIRKRIRLSQIDLARKTGLSQTRISRLEQGQAQPRLQEAVAISNALSINLGDFVEDDAHEAATKTATGRD